MKNKYFLTGFFLFFIYTIRAFECNQLEHQLGNIMVWAGRFTELSDSTNFAKSMVQKSSCKSRKKQNATLDF